MFNFRNVYKLFDHQAAYFLFRVCLRETKQVSKTDLNLNHPFFYKRSRQIRFKLIDSKDLFILPERIEFLPAIRGVARK